MTAEARRQRRALPERLPMDAAAPPESELRTATLALGCFWGPDARFGIEEGVVRTRAGYTGGQRDRPTYHDLGRHIETVQLDYEPTRLTYEDLLEIFWESHEPTRVPHSRQYQSAIFVHDEEQRRAAARSRDERQAALEAEVVTEVTALETFWLAEAYHQKYHLRQHPDLLREFREVYSGREFVDSTVAARVNAYCAGHGSERRLSSEIDQYGLAEEAGHVLRALVRQRSGPR